jgi:hypothetical protein
MSSIVSYRSTYIALDLVRTKAHAVLLKVQRLGRLVFKSSHVSFIPWHELLWPRSSAIITPARAPTMTAPPIRLPTESSQAVSQATERCLLASDRYL